MSKLYESDNKFQAIPLGNDNPKEVQMTKTKCLFFTVGIALAMAFTLSCSSDDSGGGDDGQTATYTGVAASGVTYTLKISKGTGRSALLKKESGQNYVAAAYSPQSNDDYELTTSDGKRSTGKVIYYTVAGVIEIEESSGGMLAITVNGSSITQMHGTINWEDGSVDIYDYLSLTPGDGGDNSGDCGMGWPPDARLSQVGLGGLSSRGITCADWRFHQDGEWPCMELFFDGSTDAKTNILSYFASKGCEYDKEQLEFSIESGDYHTYSYYPPCSARFSWNLWSNAGGEIIACGE